MKNNKGITLIALVITIIVLLILAGVSIALLTGENGILNQAQQAKTTNSVAEEKEKIKLAYMDYKMLKEREIEGRTLIVNGATEVTGNETSGWTIKFGDNLYNLSSSGEIGEGAANIKFYIDNVEYSARYGMNWQEWCNSDYNTNRLWSCDEYYIYSGNVIVTDVGPTSVIVSGEHYSVGSHTGGGSN